MFSHFDRIKKVCKQTRYYRRVLNLHMETVLFSSPLEFQGKVSRSNYHILITNTHLQKPLSA